MKKTRKASLHTLWIKASKALQDWSRAKGERCVGCNMANAVVVHHHMTWSRSIALRFDESNLCPLCAKCHYNIHKGHLGTKINIESTMRDRWGKDWEYNLLCQDRNWKKKTGKEMREWLERTILEFKK